MTTTSSSAVSSSSSSDNIHYVMDPPPIPSVAIAGAPSSTTRFPVHRIYCVGRNYADHVTEMGGDPKTNPPTFFTKPANAVVDSGSKIPYPINTNNLHYEVELVVALASPTKIFGYGVGIDLTRRDLQKIAKASSSPWDCAKAFDRSAPVGPITPNWTLDGNAKIELSTWVNTTSSSSELKQSAMLQDMIWSVPEIMSELAKIFELQAGDLIFTGTPSGVGPLQVGDSVEGRVDGLEPIQIDIV